jgi:hypothetical protein
VHALLRYYTFHGSVSRIFFNFIKTSHKMQYLNEYDEFLPQNPGARAQDMREDACKSTGQKDKY